MPVKNQSEYDTDGGIKYTPPTEKKDNKEKDN